MSAKALKSKLYPSGYISVPFAQYTGTKSDGTIVDRKGYNSVAVLVTTGTLSTVGASHYFTPSLLAGDASDLSDGATATELDGSFEVINAAGDADSCWIVGYYGQKRYLRVVLTETGTSDINAGAHILLGDPIYGPGGSTNS